MPNISLYSTPPKLLRKFLHSILQGSATTCMDYSRKLTKVAVYLRKSRQLVLGDEHRLGDTRTELQACRLTDAEWKQVSQGV